HAAEDVTAANHHRQFHTQPRHFRDVGDHAFDGGAIDAERIVAHQRFARQFEEDSLVGWFCHEWGSCGDRFRIRYCTGRDRRPVVKTGLAARSLYYCLAAAIWAATSAAKSSTFFSMPSPTTYI